MSITCYVKQVYFFKAMAFKRRRKDPGFYRADHYRPQTEFYSEPPNANYTMAGSCRAIKWESVM